MKPVEKIRRPVQVAQGIFFDDQEKVLKKRPLCLCDDGSIWELVNGSWERLPSIPQTRYEILAKSEREIW